MMSFLTKKMSSASVRQADIDKYVIVIISSLFLSMTRFLHSFIIISRFVKACEDKNIAKVRRLLAEFGKPILDTRSSVRLYDSVCV